MQGEKMYTFSPKNPQRGLGCKSFWKTPFFFPPIVLGFFKNRGGKKGKQMLKTENERGNFLKQKPAKKIGEKKTKIHNPKKPKKSSTLMYKKNPKIQQFFPFFLFFPFFFFFSFFFFSFFFGAFFFFFCPFSPFFFFFSPKNPPQKIKKVKN